MKKNLKNCVVCLKEVPRSYTCALVVEEYRIFMLCVLGVGLVGKLWAIFLVPFVVQQKWNH